MCTEIIKFRTTYIIKSIRFKIVIPKKIRFKIVMI